MTTPRGLKSGHGFKVDRYTWSDEELAAKIMAMLTDKKMKAKLQKTSKTMRRAWANQVGQDHRWSHPRQDRLMPTKLDSSAPHSNGQRHWQAR